MRRNPHPIVSHVRVKRFTRELSFTFVKVNAFRSYGNLTEIHVDCQSMLLFRFTLNRFFVGFDPPRVLYFTGNKEYNQIRVVCALVLDELN